MERASDPSNAETVAIGNSAAAPAPAADSRISSSTSSTVDEGRFVAGTLLGGRYRIIGLLGRGGMGEVYRATDLTLAQSVALKFLPAEATQNPRLLERFHGEVRVARQVSHPNVCRVYDIGEIEGMPFISMEYVDGEDLASLLLRIGRLPADKALETARKLCAGLAAAHDRGVIHRDLKPQNIMINKRGEVVIMDFGLAAIADQLSGSEARNGTPAYMSPEALKGAEVTSRSDIYALGLVLYELFTGKRPYDAKTVRELISQQESAQLTSMTSIAADIDPAVEKAIRRCLDPDPARRPPTPLAVAVALPGGDPLAAALAAGETPSPELVAAAGQTEGLARKYSIPCLALVAICLFASPLIRQRTDALMNAPLDYPPEALARKAREVAASLGYPKKPADSAMLLGHRNALIDHLQALPEPRQWDEWLAAEAPIQLDYRESQSDLISTPFGQVTLDNPPPTQPGMVRVTLDGNAHLREFSAVPYRSGPELNDPVPPDAAFRAAGLDMAAFQETTPAMTPPYASDQVHAWKGPHPKLPHTTVTLEMASWKGRPTLVHVGYDWPQQPAAAAAAAPKNSGTPQWVRKFFSTFTFYLFAVGLLFIVLLAWRNLKLGRTDPKGAFKLAVVRFVLAAVVWCGTVHAMPDEALAFLFFSSVGEWLLSAGIIWLVYLALEPALRAQWPHSIVTWNRLLAGRWRDPQVCSHVLIGAAVGTSLWVSASLIELWAQPAHTLEAGGALDYSLGTRHWIAGHAGDLSGVMLWGLVIFFTIFGLRRMVRINALAAILGAAVMTPFNGGVITSPRWQVMVPIYVGLMTVLIFILLRYGLVATISAMFFINATNVITLGADWKAWWAPAGLATLLLLLGIALYAFWRSLGGRELIGEGAYALVPK